MQILRKKIFTYLFFILSAVLTGLFAAFLIRDNAGIYSDIKTPFFAPPGFLFPVVWTVLYILMGVSAALVYTGREKDRNEADKGLLLYAGSLTVNFIWCIIFFNFRMYSAAFVLLAVLLLLIIKTVLSYRKISPAAAYLQIPYILWVSFAGILNFSICILN